MLSGFLWGPLCFGGGITMCAAGVFFVASGVWLVVSQAGRRHTLHRDWGSLALCACLAPLGVLFFVSGIVMLGNN